MLHAFCLSALLLISSQSKAEEETIGWIESIQLESSGKDFKCILQVRGDHMGALTVRPLYKFEIHNETSIKLDGKKGTVEDLFKAVRTSLPDSIRVSIIHAKGVKEGSQVVRLRAIVKDR